MLKKWILRITSGLTVCFYMQISFAAVVWRPIDLGLDYAEYTNQQQSYNGTIRAFRVDLKHYRLSSAQAREIHLSFATVKKFVTENQAALGINGGFFNVSGDSLGLRINDFKVMNPLRKISWWGVFYIRNNKPYIASNRDFALTPSIIFAIQSGPRLIIQGSIPHLKPGIDERSALGITKDKKVIILVTDNLPLSTTELAQIMQKQFACSDAINLDGGTSSQLYARLNTFSMNVLGLKPVADAILVFKKK
ncbi:MAG: phosphodiester glycosidase family protein [Gammaproteobacteria bacterium]